MTRLMKTSLLFVFLLLGSSIISQTAIEELGKNRTVIKYYPGFLLHEIDAAEPDKIDLIRYYFTESFIVTDLSCSDCRVDFDEFFNYYLFDVSQFENLRLQQAQNTFVFKEKFEVTLVSLDDVLVNLNGTLPADLLHLRVSRPFPEWNDTGNGMDDYAKYKNEVMKWARDFPEEYRTLTSGSLLKVRINDFLSLSPERKTSVLTHPDGYLLID